MSHLRYPVVIIAAMTTALAGCANKSDGIAASYVSPTIYQAMTCQQLATEAQTVANAYLAIEADLDPETKKMGDRAVRAALKASSLPARLDPDAVAERLRADGGLVGGAAG